MLGTVVCLLPGVWFFSSLLFSGKTLMDGLGAVVFILALGGLVILPLLLLPIFWLVGWRPGALFVSLLLLFWSWGFNASASDVIVANLLRLHVIPIAVLIWEWRASRKR
ncbi:hypothetical protein E7T06_11340 [Deinococcus sp. Arct2-2]|uniref:hypothetical protein n=1 Tax=Deinococcus sp. Arct2-2 TaxID=2568653 RepID=UPI0010A397B9|nr:hypothetical protein [Deinococcus sp. Arct2-2]THF69602.1 hypothetical protein E7T06_11340 [Deinococcus sp. Arct2-2]